jgi:hypothetical protein
MVSSTMVEKQLRHANAMVEQMVFGQHRTRVGAPRVRFGVRSRGMDEAIVGTYSNQAEAEMWAEVLRDAGITCRIARGNVEVAAVGFDAWVPHTLRVRAEDATRAAQYLPPVSDSK